MLVEGLGRRSGISVSQRVITPFLEGRRRSPAPPGRGRNQSAVPAKETRPDAGWTMYGGRNECRSR